ncbi:neutral zinc metallopeptidase [Umezawaea endophytica]|uniref:Neutral zinc metallopeptidase n=1 Tax=Umezawaea endophytica TaxID=1654476 RepID=A0A9X2VNH9_9PSEU|nr:neutral zinc metallopeptidase [Umezawaea endophytica]MCS7479682.1 neutral zinc metallopeptidase [Umezawaea endophytica]
MPDDSAAVSAVEEQEAGRTPVDATAAVEEPAPAEAVTPVAVTPVAVTPAAAEDDLPANDEAVPPAAADEPADGLATVPAAEEPTQAPGEPDTFLTAEAMEFFAVAGAGPDPTAASAPAAETPVAKTFGVPEIFRASEPTQFLMPVQVEPVEQGELFELPKVVRDPDDVDTVVFTGVLDTDDLDEPRPTPAEPLAAEPLAAEPLAAERPKNSPAVLVSVFTMIICSVLGLGLLSRLDAREPVAGRPVAAPYTAAMAPTSTEPARPRAVQRLEDHPLLVNPKSLPQITCDLPVFGTSDQQLAAYYKAGVTCLDNAWGPVLKEANLPFEPPSLDAAPELSNGPCGAAPASEDAVAYYCGRNRMIYMPTGRLRENGGGDRPATHLATLAHEYGHHVQAMTGMLRAADLKIVGAGEKTPAGLEMSRRIELQANCFAGMFLGAAAGRGSISAELANRAEEDFQYAMEEAPDKNAHGSPANQGDWALSGFEANTTNACNTYAAPAAEVG